MGVRPNPSRCPKCGAAVTSAGVEFANCVSCGWEDYGEWVPPRSEPVVARGRPNSRRQKRRLRKARRRQG